MIAHEFGHVWGLKDAYNKPDIPGWHEAKKTKEVSKDNMMRSNKEVQPNDIEMILEAWKYNRKQYYGDYYHEDGVERKSKVIQYKTKGD